MKFFVGPSGSFLIFALLFTDLATSNPVKNFTIDTHELSNGKCFKDEPPTALKVNEGDPFKLTCQLQDDCPHSHLYWVKQFRNGTIKSINDSRITPDPEGNLWFSNATKSDASKDFYYACVVILWPKNEYQLGNRVILDVHPSNAIANSNKHEPVKQYVSRWNVVALQGNETELFCIYGGTPLPVTIWTRDGQRIQPNDRIKTRNYGKSLLIENVNFYDAAFYMCEVSNGVGISQLHFINLKVNTVPTFVTMPSSRDVVESESVEFQCEATGTPAPKIVWTHDGQLLIPNWRHRIQKSGRLVIQNLQRGDAGTYRCNATNSHGSAYVDVDLNVLEDVAPKIIESPLTEDDSVYGKTKKMSCRVIGTPKPTVEWMRNGLKLIGARYRITDTGDLQIQDVSFSDAGEYTCIASNKFGSVNATGHLAVKGPTRILDKPEDHEVAAGGTVKFRCEAVTDSTLTLQVDWLKDGKSIDFESGSRVYLSTDNSLSITKTTELDSGTYTCVARTDLDEVREQATLIVQNVPNPPTIHSVTCGSKEALISWAPAGDNHSPIRYYTIEYNTSSMPDTWDVIIDVIPAPFETLSVPLSPWANYSFRVIDNNRIGPSKPSSPSSVCTTPTDFPYKNPDNVTGKGDYPQSLTIKWTVMPQIEHNGPEFMYRVYYKRDIPGEEWTIEDIDNWRTNHLKVFNQPTYQRYKIKVSAINERGECRQPPQEIVGYSGEDVPLQAPGDFTLETVRSSTTAVLSWTKVPDETVRGELRGYKIEIWTDEGGEEALREVYVNGVNKTYALVTKFVPYSKNYARIRVHNGRYDGPASQVISFETPEGVPGVVTNLNAYAVGSTAMMLKWTKPIEINGILTGYKITYQKITEMKNGPGTERRIRDPNAKSLKLFGLSPWTEYRFTIRGTTKAGEGEPYFVERVTLLARRPDRPTFTWYNYNVPNESGLTNLRIIWDMKQGGIPGSHFFAKYKLVGETIYKETAPEMESNELEIDALETGRTYIVSIVAVDEPYYTESDPQEVELKIEGPTTQA